MAGMTTGMRTARPRSARHHGYKMTGIAHSRWRRMPGLTPMSRLNEVMIETMVSLARRTEAPPMPFAIITPLRGIFRQIDASSRRRLAELPFLLIDLNFGDDEHWERLLQSRTISSGKEGRRPTRRVISISLARSVIVLAWHVAQSQPERALVHFGLSEKTVHLFNTVDLLHLDRAATHACQFARPRWADRPSAWMYLLRQIQSENASPRGETIYGIQLLGADVARRPIAPHAVHVSSNPTRI
jgi:hypothetical protein